MMRARPALLFAVLIGLAFPGIAAAQSSIAPPGNSGVDEYMETIPSAGGATRPGVGAGHGAPVVAGHGVSPSTGKALAASGADGQAVLRLAGGTPKAAAGHAAKTHGDAAPRKRVESAVVEAADKQSRSVPAVIARTVANSDGGGTGPLLPIILGLAVVIGVLAVLRRRLRAH